ncbi:MAG: aspartate aminotransferase family protein [Burkholderiales bacterium]|nr:aspartate aminotransferase family protein [Burkholderiales bacterium]
MKTINAFDPTTLGSLPERQQALIRRREALLGPAYRLFYQDPVELVRGQGVWVWDAEGRRYLDAYNNVVSLGHCHPQVVQALQQQAATLNTHTRYLNEALLDYAERLLSTHHPSLDRLMFTCTGSEANDLALRLAQFHTGGTGVIVTDWAYHGVTQTTAACSPSLVTASGGPPRVYTVPAPRRYGKTQADVATTFAAGIDQAITRMQADGVRPAALLFDSLFTSDGVYGEPAGFLQAAVARARAAGMLVIADEVQPGFGRTGQHMWGYQRHGIAPDLVTMGKPMGNGHPLAGLCARQELLDAFGRETRYFNTFGGNTVSAAVGMAVLDVLEREQLLANSVAQGNYFRRSLQALAARHSWIGDVRQFGLFLGMELVHEADPHRPAPEATIQVVNGMKTRGVLISACSRSANVLKIRPPLVLERGHVDFFIEALDECLQSLSEF